MTYTRFRVDVDWADEQLIVDGDVFDGEFHFYESFFELDDLTVYIDLEKLGIKIQDDVMNKVFKKLQKDKENENGY